MKKKKTRRPRTKKVEPLLVGIGDGVADGYCRMAGGAGMTDLTKWLPLFEKCPELKPDCIYERGGSLWFLFADEDEGGILGPAPRSIAAALIRDKAVWWLARRYEWTEIYATDHSVSIWRMSGRERHDMVGTSSVGSTHFPDPLEALRLACCKVLEVET